jgi:sugar phosphate permease
MIMSSNPEPSCWSRLPLKPSVAAWQWLFILEAAPAAILGFIVFFFLTDTVQDAHWLSNAEQAVAKTEIDADAATKQHTSIRYGLTGGRVWLLCAILFLIVMGTSTVGFWQPTIIKISGVSDPLTIGLLTTVPYAAALVGMFWAGRSRGVRQPCRGVVMILIWVPATLVDR